MPGRSPDPLAAAAAAAGFAVVGTAGLPVLLALGFLFGGFGIPLYTLCVAHANDRLQASEMMAAARGLILLNGLGAAIGPYMASLFMSRHGPSGLFVYAGALLAVLVTVALLRRAQGQPGTTVSTPLPCTPQIALALDTRAGDAELAKR